MHICYSQLYGSSLFNRSNPEKLKFICDDPNEVFRSLNDDHNCDALNLFKGNTNY